MTFVPNQGAIENIKPGRTPIPRRQLLLLYLSSVLGLDARGIHTLTSRRSMASARFCAATTPTATPAGAHDANTPE